MNNQRERSLGLDVLRSIAIVLVLLRHGQFLLESQHKNQLVSYLTDTVDGVVLFFVLSGFLIGTILLKSNVFSWGNLKKFLIRRWLRTLPAYFFILLLLVFLTHESLQNQWKYLVFSQNSFTEHLVFFPESWSLSVEEWFYLLFPILVVFSSVFFTKKGSYFFVAFLFLVIPLFLMVTYLGDFNLVNKAVVYRFSNIAMGILGAGILNYFPKFWKATNRYSLALSLLLLLVFLLNPNRVFHAETLPASTFLSLIVFLSLPFWLDWKGNALSKMKLVFQKISEWSYALYLVNLSLVQGIIVKHFDGTSFQRYCLFWIVSLFFALVLHYAIEKPILRWRDKHFQD